MRIKMLHFGRKKCELCGKPFPARSNRAKYCDRCAPQPFCVIKILAELFFNCLKSRHQII